MALIGYIRVSTQEQHTDRQEVTMDNYEVNKIFIDKCSGANAHRPELKKMLEYVREGDTVIVDGISRFARNTSDLLSLVKTLDDKGVKFKSLKESIDTSTPQGYFMLTVFGAMFQLEREYSKQRQKEGIAIAKQKGVYKGRPTKQLNNFEEYIRKVNNHEISITQACKELNISRATWYRRCDEVIDF